MRSAMANIPNRNNEDMRTIDPINPSGTGLHVRTAAKRCKLLI